MISGPAFLILKILLLSPDLSSVSSCSLPAIATKCRTFQGSWGAEDTSVSQDTVSNSFVEGGDKGPLEKCEDWFIPQ